MPRRWPSTHNDPERSGYDTPPTSLRPEDIGQTKRQFIRAGGLPFFPVAPAPVPPAPLFDPQPSGVQLLAALDVSIGETAFVRQLCVAPYCPPQLADPFRGWDEHWQDFTPAVWPRPIPFAVAPATRATAQASFYTTPLGWLSYLNTGEEVFPIEWSWVLTTMPGTLQTIRSAARVPAFSTGNVRSWYLTPDIPVPRIAYPNGIPGTAVAQVGRQRMQVLPSDAMDLNLVVPGGNCLMLFAEWKQTAVQVRGADSDGGVVVANSVYPLLPSFGRMQGYLQPSATPEALDNAVTQV